MEHDWRGPQAINEQKKNQPWAANFQQFGTKSSFGKPKNGELSSSPLIHFQFHA
jgi:hypothetical protein